MSFSRAVFALLLVTLSPAPARDIRVGQDVRTIHEAVKLALPGDTIHLEPRVYRDYAGFYGKKGEPGKPITLDGHGATLEGSDPIDAAQWAEVSPGLFANDHLLPRLDDAMIARWFFVFDGRMQLMGRTSKGASAPLKRPEDLRPGEWTFVKDPSRARPPSQQIFGTFYLKVAPGQPLAAANIFAPVRSAGVQFGGDNAHLVIKNITATHPYNDGFNIHGDCREVVFENIRAIECGDDGISAHESAQYRVDGFVSIGNSTGICDTGTAQTSYYNVFISRCVGFDLYFLDNGRYRLTNAVIFSSALNPFIVTSRAGQRCELELDNVLFRRVGGKPQKALVAASSALKATRLTLENISFDLRGESTFSNCVLDGRPGSEGATGADVARLMKLVPQSEHR